MQYEWKKNPRVLQGSLDCARDFRLQAQTPASPAQLRLALVAALLRASLRMTEINILFKYKILVA